jgi:hypothetical protein
MNKNHSREYRFFQKDLQHGTKHTNDEYTVVNHSPESNEAKFFRQTKSLNADKR